VPVTLPVLCSKNKNDLTSPFKKPSALSSDNSGDNP
jgi:hypothetical protein